MTSLPHERTSRAARAWVHARGAECVEPSYVTAGVTLVTHQGDSGHGRMQPSGLTMAPWTGDCVYAPKKSVCPQNRSFVMAGRLDFANEKDRLLGGQTELIGGHLWASYLRSK